MARRPRRNHSPAFKAKVAAAAIKGEAERQPPGDRAGDQPGQRLLPAASSPGWRSEADAPDRQASHGIPVRELLPVSWTRNRQQADSEGQVETRILHIRRAPRARADDFLGVSCDYLSYRSPAALQSP
jgi:hypothetical protein